MANVPPPGAPDFAALGAQLAQALTALTNVLANLPQPAGAGQPPHAPVVNPYASDEPFDLSSRAGSAAFKKACEPLAHTWDGSLHSFPKFVTALQVKASESNWNAAAPQGILVVAGHNILTDYHLLTDAQLEVARIGRTDPRAIQNARAMYFCVKGSITGTIFSQVFQQSGNMPTTEDGVSLFKTLTTYTVGASTQLAMISFRQILDFDPAKHDFDVPTINTELNDLFVLAQSPNRRIPDSERLQHALDVYQKIRQPEEWATWVRNQSDYFEMHGIQTTCQAFMNNASLKYKKICVQNGDDFRGSTTTVTEDVVAMLAKHSKKATPAKRKTPDSPSPDASKEREYPPFVTWDKKGAGKDAAPHTVGDFRLFKGVKWFFCDCPNHKRGHFWHPHTADECRTRQRWLKAKPNEKPAAKAHVADGDDKPEAAPPADNPTDVTAMLANALPNLSGTARDHVMDALNAMLDE